METLSKIFRVRFTPSMVRNLQQVAIKMNSTPSTVARICIESVLDPRDSRSKFAIKQIRRVAKVTKGKK